MLEFGPIGSGPGREGLGSGNLGAGGGGWEDPLRLDWLTAETSEYVNSTAVFPVKYKFPTSCSSLA
ncbi:hypothetical protein SK128_002490 [Halocaridina rubra]|uniref:Uncharacterized protein n=1 Tax=Halocaridina rubra TaxID=373956 RepID=A0AAN9A4A2_HALRR